MVPRGKRVVERDRGPTAARRRALHAPADTSPGRAAGGQRVRQGAVAWRKRIGERSSSTSFSILTVQTEHILLHPYRRSSTRGSCAATLHHYLPRSVSSLRGQQEASTALLRPSRQRASTSRFLNEHVRWFSGRIAGKGGVVCFASIHGSFHNGRCTPMGFESRCVDNNQNSTMNYVRGL